VLRQEEFALIKIISMLQLPPALLMGLRIALTLRHRKPVVSAGRRSTTPGGGSNASQRPCGQLAGKRKANELGSSADSTETANRGQANGAEFAPLLATL
jgi:hypothetical protein